MQINIANADILSRHLQRKRKSRHGRQEVDLNAVLHEILVRANAFIPAESGSILLDDPKAKLEGRDEGRLCFVACFGADAHALTGAWLPDNSGIAGETYRSGTPYLCGDVSKDALFFSRIEEKTSRAIHSIICAPIAIGDATIGVIELVNKKDGISFRQEDVALLEIFAGYTSTLIQNVLDARRFEELSKRDDLTGLYNDRYILEQLPLEVRRIFEEGGDMSLIFFDLDHFKEVNDTYGHLAGSRVLTEVGMLMQEVLGSPNAVLARYGGDEFVILLPGMTRDAAKLHAERLRERIAGNTFITGAGNGGGSALNIAGIVTASIGVASLAENIQHRDDVMATVGALIKAADSAMYKAKELGKNRVVPATGKAG